MQINCFKYVEFAESGIYTWKCLPRSHTNETKIKEIWELWHKSES